MGAVSCFKRHDEFNVRGVLGGDEPEGGEIATLQSELSWKGIAMKFEVDEKHASRICDDMHTGEWSKGLDRSFVRGTEGQEDGEISASSSGSRIYSAKWPRPRGAVPRVKRLAYLGEFPRLVWEDCLAEKDGEGAIHKFADIEWVGCPRAHRWTSDQAVVGHPGVCGVI